MPAVFHPFVSGTSHRGQEVLGKHDPVLPDLHGARVSAKSFIRLESGLFVGRFGGEEYELGPTEAGLALAIRRMSQLRREREGEAA